MNTHQICNACETVKHCAQHGCIPSCLWPTAQPLTAALMRDDGGEQPTFCVMAAFRQEGDAQALLDMLAKPRADLALVPGDYPEEGSIRLDKGPVPQVQRLDGWEPTAPAVVAWRVNTLHPGGWIDGAPTAEQIEDFRVNAPSATLEFAYAATQAEQPDPDEKLIRERDDAEDFIDALLDEVLGTDRPEWSSAYGKADAMAEVHERMSLLHETVAGAWARLETAYHKSQYSDPDKFEVGQLRRIAVKRAEKRKKS